MKKTLLTLITISLMSAIGSVVHAEGVCILNSAPLTYDITRGEYCTTTQLTIRFQQAYQNCYFTDWSQLDAKVNGTPIEPILIEVNDKGYPHAIALPLNVSSINNDINTITAFMSKLRYINDLDEDPTEKATGSTNLSVKYRMTEFSTLESADDFVESHLPKHVDNIVYPYNNPPGEYAALSGDYAIDLTSMYVHFYPNPGNVRFQPYIMTDDGKIVSYCKDNIDRTFVVRDENVKFHLTVDKPITTPGKYWIVFMTNGDFRYYDTVNKFHNARHMANLKIGPYIVTEQPTGEIPTTEPQVGIWEKPTYDSDALPTSFELTIENAASLAVHKNSEANYGAYAILGADSVAVTAITSSDSNTLNIALPSNWYKGAGEYKVVITKPNEILNAYTSDGKQIKFDDGQELAIEFTVVDPNLPESLDFYVRSTGLANYEIGDGETINVRLMHDDQALGMKIFTKWTPSETTVVSTMASDTEGFTEHTGDIEISSPGRLEYYTTRGASVSPVKALTFIAKPTAGIDVPEIISSIPCEEGLYDLRGVRVSLSNPPTGIYIRRLSDGSTRKVIVR